MSINWGSVADWVSGIGSLCAVITALYLSRDAYRIKLTGFVGIRTLISGRGVSGDYVSVSATNIGHRETTIRSIATRTGIVRKRYAAVLTFNEGLSSKLPITLSDGEEANWYFKINDGDYSFIKELRDGLGINSFLGVYSTRFTIHTTHGASFVIRLERPLIKLINQSLKADAELSSK